MNATLSAARIDLDAPYALTDAQIAFYRDQGFIKLKQVFSAETLAKYGPEITRKVHELNTLHLPMEQRTTYQKAFLQVMNLWVNDDAVKRYVLSRRFAKIAADLMGVEGVRIYHDQALYKEPHGGHTPWHQDQQYWPLDGVKCVTLWMPLVDASAAMGTMRFASGSQALGYLGHENSVLPNSSS